MKKIVMCLLALSTNCTAYLPTNLTQPYDALLSEHEWAGRRVHIGVAGEYMLAPRAYDPSEVPVSAAQIYGQRESAFGMLQGAPAGTTLHQLGNKVRGMHDGERGQFEVTGGFEAYMATIELQTHLKWLQLPGDTSLSIKVPFFSMRFKDIAFTNLTKNETLADQLFSRYVVQDQASLESFALAHGNLDLQGYGHQGIGDVCAMVHWRKRFIQQQQRLRQVVVCARAGVSIPTGYDRDLSKAFDVSFGHDGAFAFPLGAGLQLTLSDTFRVGIDVGALFAMRRTRDWRLKTSWTQSEHLLLQTGRATREYGPEWVFSVYTQLVSPFEGAALSIGYQFFKHTESILYPQDALFSDATINTSQTVDVSEAHTLFAEATYNPRPRANLRVLPELTVYAKVPVNGRAMLSGYLVGGRISWRF